MFDLDGTLLLSDRSLGGYEVLPGAVEVLSALRAQSIPFVVLTNGSAYPPAEQAARLRGVGLPVADDQMLTPSSVAAELMSRGGIGRALVLGSRGVGHALAEAGIETVFTGEPGANDVDAVYVGWHPDCGMKDIEAACQAIWAGAKLYVASDVPFFATKQGTHDRLFVRHRRRDPAHDQGADDSHRQTLAARAALRRQEIEHPDPQRGRGGRRSGGGDHHGASGGRDGVRSGNRRHDAERLGARERQTAAPSRVRGYSRDTCLRRDRSTRS